MLIEVGLEISASSADVSSRVRENLDSGLAVQSLYVDSEGWSWISVVEGHNAGEAYPRSTNLPRTIVTEAISLGRQFLVLASRRVAGLRVLKADTVVVANFTTVADV